MLLGDNAGAVKSFKWFESTFPDDVREPGPYLYGSGMQAASTSHDVVMVRYFLKARSQRAFPLADRPPEKIIE